MNSLHRTFKTGIVLLAACAAIACKDSSSPPPPPDYTGDWTGKSGIDSSITFTVTSAGITEAYLGFRVGGSSCTVRGWTSPTFTTPITITNGSFTHDVNSSPLSYTFSGTFNSNTAASGTLTMEYSSGGCSAASSTVWNATKQ